MDLVRTKVVGVSWAAARGFDPGRDGGAIGPSIMGDGAGWLEQAEDDSEAADHFKASLSGEPLRAARARAEAPCWWHLDGLLSDQSLPKSPQIGHGSLGSIVFCPSNGHFQ